MGTVYKRGKTWTFKTDLPRDPITNERRQTSEGGFPTKAAATKAMNKLEGEVATGGHKGSTAYTLDEWAQTCLVKIERTLANTTYLTYEASWRLHLAPRLGHLRLGNITTAQISAALDACLIEDGLGLHSVANAESALRNFFRQAVERGLLAQSPKINVTRANRQRMVSRDDVWTPEEARSFLASIPDHYLEPITILTLATGMRQGEIRGLRWCDVNFDEGIVAIERQMDPHGRTTRLPKYDSRRRVPIGPHVVETLRQRYEECEKNRAAWDGHYEGDWVFCLHNGRPRVRSVLHKAWTRAVTRWGGRPIKFHDLRHTFATEALARGTSPKAVAQILGHRDAAITMRVYAHVAPYDWGAVATRMDGLFASG